MAGLVNAYCSVAQVKARIDPSGAGGTLDDAVIEDAITAACRMLDTEYRTRWYTTVADETRYYTADKSAVLWPREDILSITTLATDADGDRTYEDTWTTADYDLLPHNAALDGEPYTRIGVTPDGSYSFPVGVEKGVRIVGKFGYCAAANCPADVMLAAMVQSAFLLVSSKAALGVVGGGEMGQEIRLSRWHPLVKSIMAKYNRPMVL